MSPEEYLSGLREELVAHKNLVSVLRERLFHEELIVKDLEEKLEPKSNRVVPKGVMGKYLGG